MASRTCFVIMPISSSDSCSEDEWTYIFEKLIKPAVTKAGFNCKRSVAKRGNVLKDIIKDLHKSDVIIADLTDQNPNVFYELGVRHALKDGTIILSQNRKHASIFDLNNYASHVYDWKTVIGKKEMTTRIGELLKDFLKNPDKPDSPVSDFIRNKPVYRGASKEELEDVIEFDQQGEPHIVVTKRLTLKQSIGLLLLANTEKGIAFPELTKQLKKNGTKVTTSKITGTLSDMKGWVIKEGVKRKYVYRLSGTGRKKVLEIIRSLKSK